MRLRHLMLLMGLATSLGGCALVGWAADVVGGGQKIPPAFTLADRPTLVMVDDPTNKLPTVDLPNLIAGRVGNRLVERQAIGRANLMPAVRVSQLAADHADFTTWPIDRVGREAGAQQVIYAVVQQFQLVDASQIYQPVAEVRVKVIDVPSGQRLYPPTGAGHPVSVEQFYRSMDGSTRATETVLARRLAEELAVNIAKLFHEHLPAQPGERLPN